MKTWPRLFHKNRALCATDWVERFPASVVASWLGHSPMIAPQHYMQTHNAHFDLAAGVGEAAANPATRACLNASACDHAHSDNKAQTNGNQAFLVGCGVACDAVGNRGTPPKDSKNPLIRRETHGLPIREATNPATNGVDLAPCPLATSTDPNLSAGVVAWPDYRKVLPTDPTPKRLRQL